MISIRIGRVSLIPAALLFLAGCGGGGGGGGTPLAGIWGGRASAVEAVAGLPAEAFAVLNVQENPLRATSLGGGTYTGTEQSEGFTLESAPIDLANGSCRFNIRFIIRATGRGPARFMDQIVRATPVSGCAATAPVDLTYSGTIRRADDVSNTTSRNLRDYPALVRRYRDVETCTGMPATFLPPIVFVPAKFFNTIPVFEVEDDGVVLGVYFLGSNTIGLPQGNTLALEAEAVHHVFWTNGTTDESNTEHLLPAFETCDPYLGSLEARSRRGAITASGVPRPFWDSPEIYAGALR